MHLTGPAADVVAAARDKKMENVAVHRIVEQHAATRGEAPAIVCGDTVITYRDLNAAANAVARNLIAAGFRRGGHALITMPPGAELATVLLAVLKAGGAYTWLGPSTTTPARVTVANRHDEDPAHYRPIDLTPVMGQSFRAGPNLPVLTRPNDIACVLPDREGRQSILVPHATIAALRTAPIAGRWVWDGDPSTLDMWTGLLAGATLSVGTAPALMNAA